jgi:hypothetical protein
MNQIVSLRMRFAQVQGVPFNDIFSKDDLRGIIQEEAGRFRDRIYSPVVTLTTFLSQVLSCDHSCREAVSKVIASRIALGQNICSSATGPYCKARQRLSQKFLKRLLIRSGQNLQDKTARFWNWKGRSIKLVDGTTLSMPDTKENQKFYPQSKAQKPGLGFPKIRLVIMLSMFSGALVNFAAGPCRGKNTGEHALLRQSLDTLSSMDVLIGDRYFGTYFLIAELLKRAADGLFRLHSSRKEPGLQRTKKLNKDHLVVWTKPQRPVWMDKKTYQSMPEKLTLRQTKIKGKIFISTFLDFKKVTRQELVQLYTQRWLIELDLRSIKTVLQMDILRCKTPEMIFKEICVHLLAYNLIRTVMAQAAYHHHTHPRSISFKATLQLLNTFQPLILLTHRKIRLLLYEGLLASAVVHRVGNRPGRLEPRALKRRLKQYALLTQPRSIMQNRLLKYHA